MIRTRDRNRGGVASGSAPPAMDWRMPATVTTSAGLSAYGAALTASQAAVDSKTRPSFVVLAGNTDYVEWEVEEDGIALLSWLGQSGTVTITKNTVDQSYAEVFPSGSSTFGDQASGGRRQFMRMTVVDGDLIRMTVVAGAADRTLWPLLHNIPASGAYDSHIVFGASREADGLMSKVIEDIVIAADATRDPLVFNYAKSGASFGSGGLDSIEALIETAAPIYSPVAHYCILGSIIGGNVSALRPYDSTDKTTLDPLLQGAIDDLSDFVIGWANTSYRAYLSPDVTPTNQADGSLPFNDNIIHPLIAANVPDCYDSALGRSRIDEYLTVLYNRASLTDQVHGAYPSVRDLWAATWFVRVKNGSWAGITSQAETRVAAAEAAATTKATALSAYNEATYAMTALATSTAKTAFEARLAAIYPTVLFYEAVRLIDAAESSATSEAKATAQTALDAAETAGYVDAADPNNIAFQQARIDAIVVASFDQIIKVGFGSTTAVTGWNRTNSLSTGTAIADMNDDGGSATGVGLDITNAATNNSVNSGLVSEFDDIPDAILLSTWTDTSNSMGLTITGLDPLKLYDISVTASRSSGIVSSTRFSLNGVELTPDISAGMNVSVIAAGTDVAPDGSGEITVLAARAPGSSYAYFTAMVIKRKA
jgi:hypothetical protein